MKLFHQFSNLSNAIKTFPIAFICLAVLTILSIWETADWFIWFEYIGELIGATVLTLLLSLYGPLLSLHHEDWWSRKFRLINYGLQALSLVIWWIYFFILKRITISEAPTATVMLYLWIFPVVSIGIILLISYLLKRAEEDIWIAWANIIKSVAFWTLAWLIVRWGLSSALASIEALFDVDFSWHWYEYFWAFSMILLTGSFILNYYLISTEASSIILPSRIRKIFWSYIILPLAMIYLAIFLAYGVKILLTWEWPRGVIVLLGCWYFTLWLVCYYLTYAEKTTFFEIVHKILFASFLFIVAMMGCAIIKRINQYWVTINRYLVCALIVSIALFSILALCYRRKRLLSLVAVFFFAALVSMYWWPFRASSVTLQSQKSRLISLLEKEGISIPLWDNSLANLTGDSARLIAWALDEILDDYEVDVWSWSLIASENLTGNNKWYSLRLDVHSLLWLQSYYPLIQSENQYFSFRTSKGEKGIDIKWYSKIYDLSLYNWKEEDENIKILPNHIWWELNLNPYLDDIYAVSKSNDKNEFDEFYIIEENWKKYVINSINWEKKSDWTITINWVYWYLLVK